MALSFHIDIVSADSEIFSGRAEYIIATGSDGELGVWPGHTPLLTTLKEGHIRVATGYDHEEVFYVSGGILEVQPHTVTVLAETVTRAADIDEERALAAKERAQQLLQEKKADFDYAKANTELAQAVAQLQTLNKLRKKLKIEK